MLEQISIIIIVWGGVGAGWYKHKSRSHHSIPLQNGSIKMVIDAIHNHSNDETVVTRALIAITNVCFNNDLNRIIAKKLGAVEAIVTGKGDSIVLFR